MHITDEEHTSQVMDEDVPRVSNPARPGAPGYRRSRRGLSFCSRYFSATSRGDETSSSGISLSMRDRQSNAFVSDPVNQMSVKLQLSRPNEPSWYKDLYKQACVTSIRH